MTNTISPITSSEKPKIITASFVKAKPIHTYRPSAKENHVLKFASDAKRVLLDLDFGQRYSESKYDDFYKSYYTNHSTFRTIKTWLIITLIPTFCTISLMLLPVGSLSDGLSGQNWFSVVQAAGFGAFVGILLMNRFRSVVEESALTWREHYIAILIVTLTSVLTFISVSLLWRYPPPFAALLCGGNGCGVFCATWLYYENKLNPEKEFQESVKKDMITAITSVSISYSTTLLHEAVGVLYTSQAHSALNQGLVSICLPLLKFSIRFAQSWLLKTRKEGFGTMVASFEVEFFNKIYTSIFLQNTTNLVIIVTLLSFDVMENMLFIKEMNEIASKSFAEGKTRNELQEKKTFSGNSHVDRKLLFRTEVVGLIEVVEALTPLMYLTYICIMRVHPNLKYISTLSILSDAEFHKAVENILLYAMVELISILGLMVPLWYRFRLPLFFQTGYSMREYKWTIISLMNLMLFISFTGPYLHFGNDYTFKFEPIE